MKKFFVLYFLLLMGFHYSFAQWQLGFGYTHQAPVCRFNGSIYQQGGGMFFNLTTSSFLPRKSKYELSVGAYFDYFDAGKKQFDIVLDDPPNGEGRMRFGNSTTGHNLITRFGYKATEKITFFTDGLIGHRKFYSEILTGLKSYDPAYSDNMEDVFSQRLFRYGIGFGTRIGLKKSFGFEIRADYTRGGEATYFNLKTIKETNTSIEYESETWPHTDLFMWSVAFNWKLYKLQRSSYSSGSSPSSPTNTYQSPSTTTSPTKTDSGTTPKNPPKKTVTPQKKAEPKKEINW
ncbi:MAG: hypothetical protein H6607_02510 [Flavobacteriales bacterium]|nr:hypothetical protein [Flavobacteriales bacterium]